jgi:hypothetical protein
MRGGAEGASIAPVMARLGPAIHGGKRKAKSRAHKVCGESRSECRMRHDRSDVREYIFS